MSDSEWGPMGEPVSREEFRMLLDRMAGNERRVDAIDVNGTRGVMVLAVQVQELGKDLAAHELRHDQEAGRRVANRKWMVMAMIALVGAIDAPIVTVLLATHPH